MTDQQSLNSLDRQFASIRIIYYFMFGSQVLYIYLSEVMLHLPVRQIAAFYQAIVAVCLCVLIVGIVLRKRLVDGPAAALRANPDDLASLQRWKAGQIATYALAEAVVLFGFVVRVLGSGRPRAFVIYAAGLVFMTLWAPRRPQ